ncbi:hypothetical protein SEA_ANON_60 [Gordonia phage Anon]|nr:hypothetical protein SEA_ANON_60 [Gordonia phage Anon]
MSDEDDQKIELLFKFPAANEEVTVTVTGFNNPQAGLEALMRAGSRETIDGLLETMKAQAQQ